MPDAAAKIVTPTSQQAAGGVLNVPGLPDCSGEFLSFASGALPHLPAHGINQRVALELSYMKDRLPAAQGALWQSLVFATPEMGPLIEWLKEPGEDRDAERRRNGCQQSELKQLGALYLLRQLVTEDQLLAAKVLEALKSQKEMPLALRASIEAFYARAIFSEKSPFGASLARELNNKNSDSESGMLSGILIGLTTEAFDRPSEAALMGRRLFNGAPKEIADLVPAPMPRRLVRFLLERVRQHEAWSETRHQRVMAREAAKQARSEEAAANAALRKRELENKVIENERLQRIYGQSSSAAVITGGAAKKETVRINLPPKRAAQISLPPRPSDVLKLPSTPKETVRINLPPKPAGPRSSLPPRPSEVLKLPSRAKETVRINLPPRSPEERPSADPYAVTFTRTVEVALSQCNYDGRKGLAEDAHKRALQLQLDDPAAFKEANDAWQDRLREVEGRGVALKISKQDAEQFCRLNVFPLEWFSSKHDGSVVLKIPKGEISFDDHGLGASWFQIGPKGAIILESAQHQFPVFQALQTAIEQYDWPYVKRIS